MAEGMPGLMPTIDIGNNGNCNGGWGNLGGALIGGAIGGAIGSNWNVRNGSCGCGCNNNDGVLPGLYLMDSLSSLRTDTASIGRDNMLQTFGLQSANCQGFAGIHAAVERVGAQLAQGQSRTEAAVLTTALQGQLGAKDNTIAALHATHAAEVQNMRNTFEIVSSQKDCCCETNRNVERLGCEVRTAVHAEGEATRALIAQLDRERLQEKLCDAKSRIGALEAQNFASGLAAGYAQQGRNDLNSAVSSIIGHMAAFRTTGGTTPTA